MNRSLIDKTALQLEHLGGILYQLNDEIYTQPVDLLSGATIGQHTRHIIEFFQELNNGYYSGIVNYDARKRDMEIENFRGKAMQHITSLKQNLCKPDRPLLLLVDAPGPDSSTHSVSSNYLRELLYNLEHTVHHMALLRIAVKLLSTIDLPESFGVAEATIKYRQACAQ